jgi:hypothetical protein
LGHGACGIRGWQCLSLRIELRAESWEQTRSHGSR